MLDDVRRVLSAAEKALPRRCVARSGVRTAEFVLVAGAVALVVLAVVSQESTLEARSGLWRLHAGPQSLVGPAEAGESAGSFAGWDRAVVYDVIYDPKVRKRAADNFVG